MSIPVPMNEAARLEALDRLQVLDTPPEPFFDAAADIARRLLDVPVALVGLIDAERHWFKAHYGTELCENGRDASICTFAIMSDAPMIVPDTLLDARTAACPIVVDGPRVRYYVGAPLILSNGLRVGTLCAIGFEPRPAPSEDEVAALESVAAMIVHELERRREGAPPAARVEQAKAEFLSLVSHELRTPLNGVLGFGAIVAEHSSCDSARQFARHIVQSADHLGGLIDRVIAFTRADAGELRLKEERIDLPLLLEEVAGVSRGVANAPDAPISLDASAAPETLVADRAQLRQMLVNLVANALIHGGGSATLAVAAGPHGEVEFRIDDSGPGLSPETMSTALGVFSIAESALTRRGEGLGLGLPLTQRLAKLHGGALQLGDRPGGGLSARVVLPAWRSRGPAESLLGAA